MLRLRPRFRRCCVRRRRAAGAAAAAAAASSAAAAASSADYLHPCLQAELLPTVVFLHEVPGVSGLRLQGTAGSKVHKLSVIFNNSQACGAAAAGKLDHGKTVVITGDKFPALKSDAQSIGLVSRLPAKCAALGFDL